MLLMIDNYDSFTYNLVQYLGELGEEVRVLPQRRDHARGRRALEPAHIVISPGPLHAERSGDLGAADRGVSPGKIPILGVCLGHQASARRSAAGSCTRGSSCTARPPPSTMTDAACSAGCRMPFTATRYHSLVIERASLPGCLEVSAWTDDGEIMGVRHKDARGRGRAVPSRIHPHRARPPAAAELSGEGAKP